MSTAKMVLAAVLALAGAGCGQLGQGKATPPAEGDASASADAASTDAKPAEEGGDKPAAPAEAPAGSQPDKPT